MSGRKLKAIVVATLTLGLAVLTAGPAQAEGSAPAAPQAGTERNTGGLTLADVAKRSGVSAAALAGPYHIVNRHSRKCLTVQNASLGNTAPVVQYTCESSAPYNEDWYYDAANLQFINGHSFKCLTVQNASLGNTAPAVQYTCDNSAPYNESWYGQENTWHIVNVHSNKCLTVKSASLGNNAPVVQYTCDNSAPYNEDWELILS
jgi:hypothetical protein